MSPFLRTTGTGQTSIPVAGHCPGIVELSRSAGRRPASTPTVWERPLRSRTGGGEEDTHRSAVDAVDGLLDEVELALARLDDGTYGRCEACGTPIDDGDLAARPLVRECGTVRTGVLVVEGV